MDLNRLVDGLHLPHPGRVSPAFARIAAGLVRPLVRLCHRPSLSGLEHLPRDRPFLLVGNHSGGLGLAEITCLLALYLEQAGPDRPLAGFAHPLAFRVFPFAQFLHGMGAVPATYAAAERTLAAGTALLVFPGGDHETMRPIWQANRVDFGGRVGFLRVARTAGVDIVPMGIRGGHMTAPVLLRSRLLAWLLVLPRLLGIKRWGLSALGLVGALALVALLPLAWPWRLAAVAAWLTSPLAFTPWLPWTVRIRVGPPIAAAELFSDGGSAVDLARALAQVQAAVQELVDRPASDAAP